MQPKAEPRRSLVTFIFVICFYFHSLYFLCYAELVFNLNQGQQLKDTDDEDRLLSADGVFKLGFFHPGSSSDLGPSSNSYLGIWYGKLPNNPEAVWVANPNDPIIDSSGVFKLDFDGKLKITRNGGQPIVLNPNLNVSGNVTAFLLNNGNFVLRQLAADGTPGNVLWESFSYPTNTLLPGMKLGMNFQTGTNLTLSSWLSGQVPSPGAFRLGVDPDETNQLIVWQRGTVYWTSGVWTNGSFKNNPDLTSRSDLFEFNFVANENEKYFSYSVRSNSTHARWELNSWGQILEFLLANDGTSWENTTIGSSCEPNANYPEAVCIEQMPSRCRNSSQIFVPIRGYFNETNPSNPDYNSSLSLSDCQASCWNNCSCVAYESVHANGTGCMFLSKASDFAPNDNFKFIYVLTSDNNRDRTTTEKDTKKIRWWIWCIIAIVLTATILLFGYLCCKRRRKLRFFQRKEEPETSEHNSSQDKALLRLRDQIPPFDVSSNVDKLRRGKKSQGHELFSFPLIVSATDNFSLANKLGEGGFGPVYKGTLPDGQQIAIKRLASYSGQGVEEFMNEITLIAELQHTNLVRIFGCCIQGEEKMLIYEYMANKSLDSFLFDSNRAKLLDWKKRVNIIEGVAQGLLYLHRYSRLRVIHRDLKASNILLDEDLNPKISDFGMARIFGQNESRANTRRVVGTYGYMSPEYAMNGIFSLKSDVYSFGVLLLEIASGKKNTVFTSSGALSLIELAWDLWKRGDSDELMGESLGSSCPKDELIKFIHVGLLCVQEYAIDRPTMSDVISMLSNDTMVLPDPKQPAYHISKSEIESSAEGKSDLGSVNTLSITVMEAR